MIDHETDGEDLLLVRDVEQRNLEALFRILQTGLDRDKDKLVKAKGDDVARLQAQCQFAQQIFRLPGLARNELERRTKET